MDDGEDTVEYMKRRLLARQMEVFTAGDGCQALDVIKANAVDVVVLDERMPNMDGTDTLREIVKMEAAPKVVMLTGHGTAVSAAKGMELGAVDYLLKPCEFDVLIEAIETAYKKSRMGK